MSLRILCLLFALGGLTPAADNPARLLREARQAAARGDFGKAYLKSSQAVALDPNNPALWQYSTSLRELGAPALEAAAPPGQPTAAGENEEAEPLPGISAEDYLEAKNLAPPQVLAGEPGAKSFRLTLDARRLIERVLGDYGIQVVFDTDFPTDSKQISFELAGAGWREAVRALENASGSFFVAMGPQLALAAKDTTQKRAEIEPVATMLIPIPDPLSPQEVQEAARAVQGIFDMTKMGIDNARRVVLFRDRASKLACAAELFRQLAVPRGEVLTEVDLLGVSENSSLSYGLSLPSSFTLTPSISKWALVSPLSTGIFGLTIGDASLVAALSRGTTRTLVHGELRATDGQPATFHVGDRYPIMTAGYFGNTSGGGKVYTPPPTVNFQDLGVVLKVTPHLHGSREVTLEVEAEFKSLGSGSLNGIPVISNRKFAASVRMKYEETALMAGLVTESISQSWSGIPIFLKVPGMGDREKTTDRTALLLSLRPRLVRLPPSEALTAPVWVGTEARPLTPLAPVE